MRFSQTLTVVLGVLVPIAETVRRWNTWREALLALLDDYMLAALVLSGVWLGGRDFWAAPQKLVQLLGESQTAYHKSRRDA